MADYVVIDKEQLESDLTVVADAIREKGGTSEQLAFPSGMADAVMGIQSGGVDWFQYASSINGMFSAAVLPENTEIELNIPNVKNLGNTFQGAINVKKVKLKGNINGNVVRLGSGFWGASNLETIDLSEFKCTFGDMGGAFRQCPELKYIYGEFDCTSTTTMQSIFLLTSALEHIRFKKGTISVALDCVYIKNLTDESIQSIIDGLATVETSQTLTFHKDVKNKLTEAQISQITSKNWTLS